MVFIVNTAVFMIIADRWNMRGGADLHMHPMASPGRGGETGLVDMTRLPQVSPTVSLRGGCYCFILRSTAVNGRQIGFRSDVV